MAAEKRAITLDDLYQQKFVEDIRVSPDGYWVAYIRVDIDKAGNSYRRNLWISDLQNETSEPRQFTRSNKDSSPRWSPDGKWLAFLSGRGEKPQVYLLSLSAFGGEAHQLTQHPNGVSNFNWSPDSQRIAFLANVNEDEIEREASPESEGEPKLDKFEAKAQTERREDAEKRKSDPRVVRRIPYRVGVSYTTDRYAQVYVINIKDGAKQRRLTSLPANYQEPQWSPDGKTLWTARPADFDADEPFRQSRLYRIAVENGRETEFNHGDHTDYQPLPSPDGRWLAFLRFPEDKASMHYNRLSVVSTEGGEVRDLNLEADVQPTVFRWQGDMLYFAAEREGAIGLYRVSAESGEVETVLTGDWRVESFDVAADRRVVFIAGTQDKLQEAFALRPGSTTPESLTQFNQPLLDQISVQPYHQLRYQAPDGQQLEGWYLLPADFHAGETYPFLLYIHGGPHIMWGPSNPIEWYEWQNMAAQGYVVMFCNPRGSGGYGEAFQMSVHAGGWSDLAYGDIMAGVDVLIEKGFIDTERMAITGGSYGGYMTVWTVGHTDRFCAAVAQRGVYNLLSFFGTTDIPSFVLNEFGTLPTENPQFLWDQSPLAHAHKIRTPLLIIHSENDYRVPISEAEQLFGYLKRVGVETEFVRFPRDGHELTRSGEPEHRVEHLRRILDWVNRYCKPEAV
jgi:dipeptidyl aminopeptidase/acylaminoacyl peptidase